MGNMFVVVGVVVVLVVLVVVAVAVIVLLVVFASELIAQLGFLSLLGCICAALVGFLAIGYCYCCLSLSMARRIRCPGGLSFFAGMHVRSAGRSGSWWNPGSQTLCGSSTGFLRGSGDAQGGTPFPKHCAPIGSYYCCLSLSMARGIPCPGGLSFFSGMHISG